MKKVEQSLQFVVRSINNLSTTNYQLPTSNYQKGFTLIELLVVISIVGTMLVVGLGSFATAQKKGRDSRRKSDIKEIQTALEQYYSVCDFSYPTPPAGNFYTSISCSSTSAVIMPTVPADPRVVTPYYCPPPVATNCTSTSYTVCAKLESETPDTFCVSNSQ